MAFSVRQLPVGGFDHNFSYLVVADNGDAALVDPTGEPAVIRKAVEDAGQITPRYILLTHGHLDHWQALGDAISFFPAPIASHPTHPEVGKIKLYDHQRLPFGDGFIEAIFTPGHSRDSVCFRLSDDSGIFTGDVLFIGCVGFCRSKEMYASLMKKIIPLADSNCVWSGHDYGPVPVRSLGEEKKCNAYLRCASLEEFKEQLRKLD